MQQNYADVKTNIQTLNTDLVFHNSEKWIYQTSILDFKTTTLIRDGLPVGYRASWQVERLAFSSQCI